MSRARPVQFGTETYWFDMRKARDRASDEQVELLAVVENVELDDLLDAVLTQAEVLERLRYALGQDPVPTDVLRRRARWRAERQILPECRLCGRVGDSTKHHFVPKWLLRELSQYGQEWSSRSRNCIDVCIDCHRRLHQRDDFPKSMIEVLSANERAFTNAALSQLADERPKLLLLLARGSDDTYETRLVRDWLHGAFDDEPVPAAKPHLRAA